MAGRQYPRPCGTPLLDLYDDAGLRNLAQKWKLEVGADWNRKGLLGKLEQAIGDEKLNLGLLAEWQRREAIVKPPSDHWCDREASGATQPHARDLHD